MKTTKTQNDCWKLRRDEFGMLHSTLQTERGRATIVHHIFDDTEWFEVFARNSDGYEIIRTSRNQLADAKQLVEKRLAGGI